MTTVRIALASPAVAGSLQEALEKVDRMQSEAAAQGAAIVCFPEAYVPGLRGLDFGVYPYDRNDEAWTLGAVAYGAGQHRIATILGHEQVTPEGRQIAATVIDATGSRLGVQVKTQLDPSEDAHYVPGDCRALFDIDDLRFGVSICHEGWRYPETVRWAAVRGAHVVFHPQHTGAMTGTTRLTEWGASGNPYYEQAMRMRARENTVYFASVNYALPFPESATSIIDPDGNCAAYLPYGTEGVLVADLDLGRATGLLAKRFAPERYGERTVGNQIFVVHPYLWNGVWVIDDPAVGLEKEPLIAGVPRILLTATARAGIANPERGFTALFSKDPFPGADVVLEWVRAESRGNVYTWQGMEGWLCPALYRYFERAPERLHFKVRASDATGD